MYPSNQLEKAHVHKEADDSALDTGTTLARRITFGGMGITITHPKGSIIPPAKGDDAFMGLFASQDYGHFDGTMEVGVPIYVWKGPESEGESAFLVPVTKEDQGTEEFQRYDVVLGFEGRREAEAFVTEQFGSAATENKLQYISTEDVKRWVELIGMKKELVGVDDFLKDPEVTIKEVEEPPLFVTG